MKIGVDLGHIAEGASGGIVPYLQGVLGALFAGWPQHEVVVFGTPGNDRLFPNLPAHVQRLTLDAGYYYPLLGVSAAALRIDVLISGYPSEAEVEFPPSRRVIVVPDCQHEYYPEFFDAETLRSRRCAFAKALREAGAIATLSEHARRTILEHPESRCAEVVVSSPALPAEGEPAEALAPEGRDFLPPGDFFIYPANLWPHKNHRRVLEAFGRFLSSAPRPVELVLTGYPEGWDELRREFPSLPVRHLGFVGRGRLRFLFSRAKGLVFFSLFEGFGMPLLEAFAAGIPVACGNTTSLPEVGGDAVLTCDPTDPAAMSACMERLYSDGGLRARLVERGRERLRHYQWGASAAQLVGACQRAASRAAGAAPEATPALRRVVQFIHEIQADREARLKVIQDLHDHIRASEAEQEARQEAQREAIRRLEEALREADQQLETSLRQFSLERESREAVIRQLEAALREPLTRRFLRRCKRALSRVAGKLARPTRLTPRG